MSMRKAIDRTILLPPFPAGLAQPTRELSDTLRALSMTINSESLKLSISQLKWLRDGLMAIGNGERDARRAFGLPNKQGRAEQPQRAYLMAVEHHAFMLAGSDVGDADEKTSHLWAVTPERVRQNRRAHGTLAKQRVESWLAIATQVNVSHADALKRLHADIRHYRLRLRR